MEYKVKLKHNIDSDNKVESNELCYILNNNVHCLKGGNPIDYEENKSVLLESFGEDNCLIETNIVDCKLSSNLEVYTTAVGAVAGIVSTKGCTISPGGYASC